MAAAYTDKLKKLSRRWVGQIGSGGVTDDTVTTIPLSSTTNLPTDTAVVAVIDRVDVNGNATPLLEETVIGVVSGSNLIDCIRAAEGTAQAHDSGAVVEILFTAKGWNDLIDALLVSHLQDGRISGSAVTASNVAASAITSGTISASAVTLGNLAASSVVEGNINFNLVTASSTTTFTNKRINPRIVTAASYTTDTGTALDVSTCDEFDVTAQAGALKLNNPSGTPVNGQKLIVRIKDNGTARALTYDTQYRASSDLALPTTTVVNKTLYMGFIYNSADTRWDLLAVLNNF